MDKIIRLEDSHPQLAKFIQKIALNKSTKFHTINGIKTILDYWSNPLYGVRVISNGFFLGIGNKILARAYPKLGRNESCFCGSKIKYKKCCGRS